MKGVLDRIEDGKAVILVETEQKEYIIAASSLPAGSRAGMWFNLIVSGDEIINMTINQLTTNKKEKVTSQLREKLLRNKKQSKYKRT